jgi:hypothetical protein
MLTWSVANPRWNRLASRCISGTLFKWSSCTDWRISVSSAKIWTRSCLSPVSTHCQPLTLQSHITPQGCSLNYSRMLSMSRSGCLSHCPRSREPCAVLHLFSKPNKLIVFEAPSWGLGIKFNARSAEASRRMYCERSWCLRVYLPKAVSSERICSGD